MADANRIIHVFVSGRVQGVSFRQHTKTMAISLNVAGWVRNLVDGRVEILARGEALVIDQFIRWLRVGPPAADVKDLVVKDVDDKNPLVVETKTDENLRTFLIL